MERSGEAGFDLISVHADEGEELVIHAGAPRPAAPAAQPESAPAAAPAPDPAAVTAQDAPGSHPGASGAPAAGVRDAERAELRRRAEEIARAEDSLRDPHTFAHMRRAILVILAALTTAFVAYCIWMFFLR